MKIYVSSTFEDLKDFRRAVYSQLRKVRIDVDAMEDYAAADQRPLKRCREGVAAADLYIGIFAWRYGFVPPEDNPERLSITELEYLCAGEHGKERLVFLLRDDAPWPPTAMDSQSKSRKGARQIQRLRDQLRKQHGVGYFATPDELAKEVAAAVTMAIMHRFGDAIPPAGARPTASSIQTANARVSRRYRCAPTMPLPGLRKGLAAAAGVGRVEDANGTPIGTGFLAAGASLHPRLGSEILLVVPAHMVAPVEFADSLHAVNDIRLRLHDGAGEFVILPGSVAWASPVHELDVTLIRLESVPANVTVLDIAQHLPMVEQPVIGVAPTSLGADLQPRVYVAGHPYGGSLAYCLDGILLDHDGTAVQYVANTSPGSAGSPVFNSLWQVIAMHRLAGRISRLRGSDRVDACQGVSLPAIRQALQEKFGANGSSDSAT